ncbi:MAG: C25 family cysteine peptidase [Candidatus Eisenbacteria bacterium]
MLDVSTPHAPHWILADNEVDGASRRLRFRYDAGAGDRPGRLLFRSGSRLAHPSRLILDREPEGGYLRERTAPAQMIIITHHDFVASAEALAEFRATRFDRDHGDIAVVDVQDIYDEFAFGRAGPRGDPQLPPTRARPVERRQPR